MLKLLLNPWVLVSLLLALGGVGAGGFKLGSDHEVASQARFDKKLEAVEQRSQSAAAEAISRIKVVNQTNATRLEREIVRVPDFSKCDAGPDVLRVLNDAITGKASAPADSGVVPGAGDTR